MNAATPTIPTTGFRYEAADEDQREAMDQLVHSFVPQTVDAFELAVRCIKRGREMERDR